MSDDSPKRFVCNFSGCGKSFSTSGHLTRHAANHSGTRKYRCDVPGCSSAFFRPDTLSQHKRIHAQRIANGLPPGPFSPLKTQVQPYEVQQPHPPPYPSPPVLASSHPIVIYQNHPAHIPAGYIVDAPVCISPPSQSTNHQVLPSLFRPNIINDDLYLDYRRQSLMVEHQKRASIGNPIFHQSQPQHLHHNPHRQSQQPQYQPQAAHYHQQQPQMQRPQPYSQYPHLIRRHTVPLCVPSQQHFHQPQPVQQKPQSEPDSKKTSVSFLVD